MIPTFQVVRVDDDRVRVTVTVGLLELKVVLYAGDWSRALATQERVEGVGDWGQKP